MCLLRNVAMRDYQDSVTTRQTDVWTDGQTDTGQSDPYVLLCFTGNTKKTLITVCSSKLPFDIHLKV